MPVLFFFVSVYYMHCTAMPVFWLLGELPVLWHESGSETDVLRIIEYLRKLVSNMSLEERCSV